MVKRPRPKSAPIFVDTTRWAYTPLQHCLCLAAALAITIALLYGLCRFGHDVPGAPVDWRDHSTDAKLREIGLQQRELEHCGTEPTLTIDDVYPRVIEDFADPEEAAQAERELLPEWARDQLRKWREERGEETG